MKRRIQISIGRLLWVSVISAILGADLVIMLIQVQKGNSVLGPAIMIPLVAFSLLYGTISRPSN